MLGLALGGQAYMAGASLQGGTFRKEKWYAVEFDVDSQTESSFSEFRNLLPHGPHY